MNLRHWAKRMVYERAPGLAGRFPYYGSQVYFPRGSWVFRTACEQGIYEPDVVRVLEALVMPNSTVFEVGTNIGLMAIPLLHVCPTCSVISFEVSPNVLPHLRRTIAQNDFGGRWKLIESAIGNSSGVTSFSVSPPGEDQLDGIRRTIRTSANRVVQVPIARLDDIWSELGRPNVSVIKCDVEGAELEVLKGAGECIAMARPAIVIEWNRYNLAAYEIDPRSLVPFIQKIGYRLFTIPAFVEILDEKTLLLQMLTTENYLLISRGSA